MKKRYTIQQIQTALNTMQGFIDISPKDVYELLDVLDTLYPIKRRNRSYSPSPFRTAKYQVLKFRRGRRKSVTSNTSHLKEYVWSWLFSFVGIALVGAIGQLHYATFIIGSFGASAVLLYGAPRSPLSQPRNLIGGHVLSALVGVSIHYFLPNPLWLSAALAVSCAILVMHITRTLHPPGGATALIATIGGQKIYTIGYGYILSPVLTGALLLLLIAIVLNNSVSGRRYPENWW